MTNARELANLVGGTLTNLTSGTNNVALGDEALEATTSGERNVGIGKDAATANKGVAIINKAKRTHAHKVQATLVMQQRAKEAIKRTKDPEKKKNITQAYKIWTDHLEKLKAKTKEMNK